MSVERIATRYAKALIELADEQGKLDKVLEDVQSFNQVSKNRDFLLMLRSPIIKESKKEKIFDLLFSSKYDELTMAFLKILLKKGREPMLAEIAEEFELLYKKLKHISSVKLTTASKLSEATVAVIRKKLKESSATDDNLELETAVNPDLIGGFVIEIEDKLYDASVAHKLNLLNKDFRDNLYISQIIAE